MSHQFREFAESFRIKLLNSSPYYSQANGQAESSNKTLLKIIKKKIEEHPKRWHEVLSEALWAHRISVTPRKSLTENFSNLSQIQNEFKSKFKLV